MNPTLESISETLLMGPGPSSVHASTLRAMSTPTIGHLDPRFLAVMDDTAQLLRDVFETRNELTFAVSGTGMSGMEATIASVVEPVETVVVCVNGAFGERMVDIAQRKGSRVVRVDAPWGEPIDAAAVERALEAHPGTKLVTVVHVETSTGVLQPLEAIEAAAHAHGALLLVDAVTSLGGARVALDDRKIDVVYSGTQKCLSCPPGLAPVSVNERARQAIRERKSDPLEWYLDISMLERYWGGERFYHHTAPINMVYALNQALHLVLEEGLEERIARHRAVGGAIQAGLEGLGLELVVEEGQRAPMLTTVWTPADVDEAAVRKELLNAYRIEIGGGIGPFKGKVWRIGTMGESCRLDNVERLLTALSRVLAARGVRTDLPQALSGAEEAAARLP